MIRVLAAALLLAAGLRAESALIPLHYRIPETPAAKLTARQRAQILEAICNGSSDGKQCDTCPADSPQGSGPFSLDRIVLGHFLAPGSEDAMVTVAGCEEMHASIGWGFLVTRRSGQWESLQEVLGLDLRHCHPMRFRSGRELLVCEDYRMETFVLMHSVSAVFAKGEQLEFRNLVTASDTTRVCLSQDRVQAAEIDKAEFSDGGVSFSASRAEMRDSVRRQALCQAAQDRSPGAAGPGPKVIKTYRIDFTFDGQRFTPSKGSQAAARLFRPLE